MKTILILLILIPITAHSRKPVKQVQCKVLIKQQKAMAFRSYRYNVIEEKLFLKGCR